MTNSDDLHVGQEQLVQLLWLAVGSPGTAESLLHLIEGCNGCYKPENSKGAANERHFSREELDGFGERLADEASRETVGALQHLLETCPTCMQAASSLMPVLRSKLGDETVTDTLEELTQNLSQKLSDWQQKAPQEQSEAPELGKQLLKQPAPRRRLLIHNSDRYSSWPLVDWLCEESKQAALRDPKEAIRIAETAVEVAESLDPERYGEAITADITSRAWAYAGNAYRVDQSWEEAELAFRTAGAWEERGTQLGNTRAEILYLNSYIPWALGRFDEAHAYLGEAIEIYRDLGDLHMEGRLRVIEASFRLKQAQPEEAVSCLKVAASQIDLDREPRLALVAKQNLILALADLERYEEAEQALPSTFELMKSTGNRLDLLRLRWTEARIDTGLGRTVKAEMALADIKESFKGMGLPFDAALAGLELANLYSTQGRTREIKLLALELVPVFARQDAHREALAAVTLFARAAAAEEATVEVVQRTLEAIRLAAERS